MARLLVKSSTDKNQNSDYPWYNKEKNATVRDIQGASKVHIMLYFPRVLGTWVFIL